MVLMCSFVEVGEENLVPPAGRCSLCGLGSIRPVGKDSLEISML
jgi:hypothetical protein